MSDSDIWFNAVRTGDCETVERLVETMAGRKDSFGQTALMIAAVTDDIKMVSVLVSREAGHVDPTGRTALMLGALANSAAAVQILAPFESEICTEDGQPPAMLAASAGAVEALLELLPYYNDVTDKQGYTILDHAAIRGQLQCVKAIYCHLQPSHERLLWARRHAVAEGHTMTVDYLTRLIDGSRVGSAQDSAYYDYSRGLDGQDSYGSQQASQLEDTMAQTLPVCPPTPPRDIDIPPPMPTLSVGYENTPIIVSPTPYVESSRMLPALSGEPISSVMTEQDEVQQNEQLDDLLGKYVQQKLEIADLQCKFEEKNQMIETLLEHDVHRRQLLGEIGDLRKELDKKNEDIATLQGQLGRETRAHNMTQDDFKELMTRFDEAQQQNVDLEDKLLELDGKRLLDLHNEVVCLRKITKEQKELLENELYDLEVLAERAEMSNNPEDMVLAHAREMKTELLKQHLKHVVDMRAQMDLFERTRHKVVMLEGEVSRLKKELGDARGAQDNTMLCNIIDDQEKEIKKLKTTINMASRSPSPRLAPSLRGPEAATAQVLNDEIRHLRSMLTSRDTMIRNLTNQLETTVASGAHYAPKPDDQLLQEKDEEIGRLNTDLNNTRALVAQLRAQCHQLKTAQKEKAEKTKEKERTGLGRAAGIPPGGKKGGTSRAASVAADTSRIKDLTAQLEAKESLVEELYAQLDAKNEEILRLTNASQPLPTIIPLSPSKMGGGPTGDSDVIALQIKIEDLTEENNILKEKLLASRTAIMELDSELKEASTLLSAHASPAMGRSELPRFQTEIPPDLSSPLTRNRPLVTRPASASTSVSYSFAGSRVEPTKLGLSRTSSLPKFNVSSSSINPYSAARRKVSDIDENHGLSHLGTSLSSTLGGTSFDPSTPTLGRKGTALGESQSAYGSVYNRASLRPASATVDYRSSHHMSGSLTAASASTITGPYGVGSRVPAFDGSHKYKQDAEMAILTSDLQDLTANLDRLASPRRPMTAGVYSSTVSDTGSYVSRLDGHLDGQTLGYSSSMQSQSLQSSGAFKPKMPDSIPTLSRLY
ncbi:Ankyrin repeat protein 3 [Giardia muris]|uniref:Ankyrin repeat protein 3 n=1 Tax=Giardia muris TaxID=5742 RepID=A0A4Z1SVA3_GIAMU|nr:Ankyrin repeat protein 3 [Giardia muris]|eukprot:TNJ27518.1 Ankyrin repeat protein 3 [Giardia muris]